MHGWPVSEITPGRALETTCDDRHVRWRRFFRAKKNPAEAGLGETAFLAAYSPAAVSTTTRGADTAALDVAPAAVAVTTYIARVGPTPHSRFDDVGVGMGVHRDKVCRMDCRRGERKSHQERDCHGAHWMPLWRADHSRIQGSGTVWSRASKKTQCATRSIAFNRMRRFPFPIISTPSIRTIEMQRSTLAAATEGTGNYDLEHRITWADGSVHRVRIMGSLIYEDDGTPFELVGASMLMD
jgi:hypothetical protein